MYKPSLKYAFLTLAAVAALALAPAALAQNTLAVTSSAAMGSSVADQNCEGDGQPGPCGLEMRFEPGQFNRAKIQHTGFGTETVYRARWFMDINNFDPPDRTRNFFFQTHGNFNMTGITRPSFRCTIQHGNGLYGIGCESWDNQLNRVGIPRCLIPADGPFEMQIEWTAGCAPTRGIFRLTTFENGSQTCQETVEVQNCALNITHQTFETLPEGGLLTSSTVYIDEFASFRTLAP